MYRLQEILESKLDETIAGLSEGIDVDRLVAEFAGEIPALADEMAIDMLKGIKRRAFTGGLQGE